jgi:hypothetical protein
MRDGELIDMGSLATEPPESGPRLRVLFVADFPRGQHIPDLTVITDYIEAVTTHSRHIISCVNSHAAHGDPCPDFRDFDVVLLHYTVLLPLQEYFPRPYAKALKQFQGLKVVILQDEFRWIDDTSRLLASFGVHMMLSSLTTENLPRVYRLQSVSAIDKCSALPGYIPERLIGVAVPAIADRPLHVTYRGRENSFWLGRMTREKIDIANGFQQSVSGRGLKCDISTDEHARLQGASWSGFLCSGRATLAVEGGASIFDFDGEAERRTLRFLEQNPGASFDVVAEQVLAPFEGNIVHQTITPRCLEAICLKTALVLFPGWYRGILFPDRHYIPLERDFSNIESVIRKLHDASYLQELVDRTYQEIAAVPDYRFRTFVRRLDYLIETKFMSLPAPRRPSLIRRILARA